MRARPLFGAVYLLCEGPVEYLIDERALSRTRHACDADEEAERDLHIYVLQVVLSGPHYGDRSTARRAPSRLRDLYQELTIQIFTCQIGRACVGKECRSRWSP